MNERRIEPSVEGAYTRASEGKAVAKARGKLRGEQPELSPNSRPNAAMHATGYYTITDSLFSVS